MSAQRQLPPGARWFDEDLSELAHASYRARLVALDRDPSPLQEAIAQQRDRRVGRYFERLIHFWLSDPSNELFRLVASGIPIRSGQQTLGELDFIVEDRRSRELLHWELAVKFYLGVRPGGDSSICVGPGLRDRLDLKVNHLLGRQLPLSAHPDARAALSAIGVVSDPKPLCFLKGRLFYPYGADPSIWQPDDANPAHGRGFWIAQRDFLEAFESRQLQWSVLPRNSWLAPLTPASPIPDAMDARALLAALAKSEDMGATAIVGLRDGIECERGFITPPSWPFPYDEHLAIGHLGNGGIAVQE